MRKMRTRRMTVMEVTMMAMISMFWTPETPVLGLCTRLQSRSRLATSLSLKIAELEENS